MSGIVKDHYDAKAEAEWNRLFQDAYHQLEYIVHMHFLEKYLPKKGLILDAGGGPGRYTIELAKRGYDIILLDLSPACLNVAKREIRKEKVEKNVKEMVEGSVTDLSRFGNEFFDAVICLGPLSHLLDRKEREIAAKELIRVAKKGAPVFVSVTSQYGVLRTVAQRLSHILTDPTFEELLSKGVYDSQVFHPSEPEGGFTDAYFFFPYELRELFENRGVQTLDMATCEGLSSHLQEQTNALYRDPVKWNRWLQIILRTCNDPSLLGLSEHFLYVGRKKA